MMKKQKRNRIETSKKLLLAVVVLVFLVTVVALVAVFVLQDAEPLSLLIPSVFGLAGTVAGFYCWKAKCENMQKYGLTDRISMDETPPITDPVSQIEAGLSLIDGEEAAG